MRRTAVTIVATIVGLVLLLQFKTHSAGTTTSGLASLGSVPTKSPSPLQVRSTPRSHRHHRASTSASPASPSTTPSTTPSANRTITATGRTIQTQYGPVQVRIVETAGRLTDVSAIQLPNGDTHSQEIAAYAAPILRTEALRANSARIDVVSGATYTSDGYAQSLQSAIDNA